MRRCSQEEYEKVLEYMKERFGIEKEVFRGFGFYSGRQGRIFLGPENLPSGVKPLSAGILIARLKRTVKPSTNFIQMFGRRAKRNILTLPREKALSYMKGENIDTGESSAEDGYVMVFYRNFPLGCGLLREGKVKNMLPKAKRLSVEFL